MVFVNVYIHFRVWTRNRRVTDPDPAKVMYRYVQILDNPKNVITILLQRVPVDAELFTV
jgi:hypothetical protein